MALDFTPEELTRYIHHTGQIIEELYSKKLDRRVFLGKSPGEVLSLFDEKLPEAGLDVEWILEVIRDLRYLVSLTD